MQPPGTPQPGCAAGAPQPHGGPHGPAPTKPRKGKGLIIGLSVGGVLTIVVAVVLYLVLPGGSTPVLPVAVGNLPAKTKRVSRSSLRMAVAHSNKLPPGDVPSEALWSQLADVACGGKDIFDNLMDTPLGSVNYAAAALAQDIEVHKQALECGKELTSSGGASIGLFSVSFEYGEDKSGTVSLYMLDTDKLPKSLDNVKSTTDPSNLQSAHCLLPIRSKLDCGDETTTVAKLEESEVWVRGRLPKLKAFGNAYSSDGGNSSSNLEAIEKLGESLKDYATTRVGTGETFSSFAIGFPHDGVSMYGEDKTKELKKVVEADSKVWGKARKDLLGAEELRIIFVAKSESGAKRIKSALKSYQAKLKEEIAKAKKKKRKTDRDRPEKLVEYGNAKRAMALRALKKAKIERDGVQVSYVAIQKPKKNESKAIERFTKWRLKHLKIAARIVVGLADGKEAKSKDIKKLGGSKLVAAVKSARTLVRLGFSAPPKSFYKVTGLRVPGGGRSDSDKIGRVTFYSWKYSARKDDLKKAFKIIAEADGWEFYKKGEDNKLTYIKKGSEDIGVMYGAPKTGGGSTLILVP